MKILNLQIISSKKYKELAELASLGERYKKLPKQELNKLSRLFLERELAMAKAKLKERKEVSYSGKYGAIHAKDIENLAGWIAETEWILENNKI